MREVYLSFLGLGSFDKASGSYRYNPTVYQLGEERSAQTAFVQVAELQLLKKDFNSVLIAGTGSSFSHHWQSLSEQLHAMGLIPRQILLKEDMSGEGQWRWFEEILKQVDQGDRLTVDLTHGYRSIPIVFSAAINFLQKARGISLDAVFYGAYEQNPTLVPIVDLKDFYLINEWADGVSRLVEDADAGRLTRTARTAPAFQAAALSNPDLIRAFQTLTDSIRNVDVDRIGLDAKNALAQIDAGKTGASATEAILLELLRDKYRPLVSDGHVPPRYDLTYFQVQLQIIRLLIEHRLFMQAYTALRECIASLGMIGFEKEGMNNKKRKKRRSRHAECFLRMIEHRQDEWKFEEKDGEIVARLRPFYDQLKQAQVLESIRKLTGKLVKFRNGFDHAWVGKERPTADIDQEAKAFLEQLKKVINSLSDGGFFSTPESQPHAG